MLTGAWPPAITAGNIIKATHPIILDYSDCQTKNEKQDQMMMLEEPKGRNGDRESLVR